MKRTACVLACLLAAATVAQAQSSGAPASSIGLPLPPIGLPLPVIGLQPEPESRLTLPPRDPGKERPRPAPPAIVIFGAPYAFGYESWQQSQQPGMIATPPETPVADIEEEPEPTGRLRLELKPADAQVFVNGEYVGTWRDVDGQLELPAGTHRIDIRAPRYEALSFDVRIAAERTITYRGELARIEEPQQQRRQPAATPPASSPTPSASSSSTIYLIPGCYLGNVPPEQVKLPAGCDLSKAITNKPR